MKKIDAASEDPGEVTQLRQEFEPFKAQLRSDGEARGETQALLAVLTARGIFVSDVVRDQILRCQDSALLDQFLARAATATSESDVLSAAA